MFDAIVLTAANGAQARGYRAELARRRKDGRLDPGVPGADHGNIKLSGIKLVHKKVPIYPVYLYKVYYIGCAGKTQGESIQIEAGKRGQIL